VRCYQTRRRAATTDFCVSTLGNVPLARRGYSHAANDGYIDNESRHLCSSFEFRVVAPANL
jgi:hypothetical protein